MDFKKIKTYSRAKPINSIKSSEILLTPVVKNEAFDMLKRCETSKTPDIIVNDWNDTFDKLKQSRNHNVDFKLLNSVKKINFEESSLLITDKSSSVEKRTLGKTKKLEPRKTLKRKCNSKDKDETVNHRTLAKKKLKKVKRLAYTNLISSKDILSKIGIESQNSFLASTPLSKKNNKLNAYISPIILNNTENDSMNKKENENSISASISDSLDYKKWDVLKDDCNLLCSTRVCINSPISLNALSNISSDEPISAEPLKKPTPTKEHDDVMVNVKDDSKLYLAFVRLSDCAIPLDNSLGNSIIPQGEIETSNKENLLTDKESEMNLKLTPIEKSYETCTELLIPSKDKNIVSKDKEIVLKNRKSRRNRRNSPQKAINKHEEVDLLKVALNKNFVHDRKRKYDLKSSDLAVDPAAANKDLDKNNINPPHSLNTENLTNILSPFNYVKVNRFSNRRNTNKLIPGKNAKLFKICEEAIVIEDSACEEPIVIEDSTLEESLPSQDNKKTDDLVRSANNSRKQKEIDTSTKHSEKRIVLLPGKKWRRSLAIFNQLKLCNNLNNTLEKSIEVGERLVNNCALKKGRNWRESIFQFIDFQQNTSIAPDAYGEKSFYDIANLSLVHKKKVGCFISPANDSIKQVASDVLAPISNSVANDINLSSHTPNESEDALLIYNNYPPVTPREIVLRRCGQTDPLPFNEVYPDSSLLKCQKIGEGLFGEVYLYKNVTGECSVMKIIPIEGEQLVNGEPQKKFNEILSEIIIVMELSNLRSNSVNRTIGFSEVKKINCVQGPYPEPLIDLWDLYDEVRGSENDSPIIFGENQLYIVLELGNAGKDFEAFEFTNAKQCYSVFVQTALALSVAEKALQFEHRDLHWGNVLICPTNEKKETYILGNRTYVIPTHGVKSTIIDFTFSRISLDGHALFTDLNSDEDLFSGTGDYQFDIYRLMKEKNRNNWKIYEPYSNILWLHYLADKMISGARYKRTNSKTHKQNIDELSRIKDSLLQYQNVGEFVEDFEFNI